MLKLNTLKLLLALFILIDESFCGVFKIMIKSPALLGEHFKEGLPYLEIMPGKIKENYKKVINIKTLNNNKTGCRKYKEDFHGNSQGNEIGILLIDSDNCSLSTKIHYAQLAGAAVLFLKYIDDKIEEAEVDHSSFEGVGIPIFMLKNSDAEYISDVLNSSDSMSTLQIELEHSNEIDRSVNKIEIFMSSQPINNPMINFLKDLKEHSRLFQNYQIDIRYSLGFCKSCKIKNYMKKEPNCLSGGRYCIINSEFKTNEPVVETLRQICIRQLEGTEKLIDYLINIKNAVLLLEQTNSFNEKMYQSISKNEMLLLKIDFEKNKKCIDDSFILRGNETEPEYNLDDNTLLKEEQEEFFKITKYNIFPLIIVNKVYYDRSINIRDFIKFGCQNHMFDCRGFRNFKKLFLFILAGISLCFVVVVIIFCRRVLRKKMANELNIKVNEAIQKYLTVDKV